MNKPKCCKELAKQNLKLEANYHFATDRADSLEKENKRLHERISSALERLEDVPSGFCLPADEAYGILQMDSID